MTTLNPPQIDIGSRPNPSQAESVIVQPPAPTRVVDSQGALGYCVAAAVALVVGYFAFGIPCGLLVVHFGSQVTERGWHGIGALLKWIGHAYVVMSIVGVFLIP